MFDMVIGLHGYIKEAVSDALSIDLDFRPGRYSADNASAIDGIVAYSVVPNLDYGQPYILRDAIHWDVHHTRILVLNDILTLMLTKLNNENPYDNSDLIDAFSTAGFRPLDVICRVSKVQNNDFIEGTDYYVAAVDILVEYVENPEEP